MRRRLTLLGLGLALFLTSPAPVRADVVTRTDGAKLRGRVISDTPEEVKIETAGGVITVPRAEVATVERAVDMYRELYDREVALEKKPTATGWLELARWCQAKELWVSASDCLKRVIAIDPGNADARLELGFRKLEGRWVTEAEYYSGQGYVQHEGRWVTKEDKEKLDQGLVPWGDDWIPQAEADRREKEAAREAEHERRGIPTSESAPSHPGADPKAKASPAAKRGRDKGPVRFFEGKLLFTKTTAEIEKALAAIEQEKIAPLPATKREFQPLDSTVQIAALRKLKAYRYLCDVPTDPELSPDYAEKCTAGCKLLELVGELTHTPKRPTGCSDSLWSLGYAGTSQSNLHQNGDPLRAVDDFIYDSDPSNVDRVGHRRWCLNVGMKATAFGHSSQWVAMYSIDQGHALMPYDAVLYPARGYFPLTHIRSGAAWSAHLSHRYAVARQEDVKVVVSPVDGNMKKGPPVSIDYLHVDSQGFGTGSSCVIFRPSVSLEAGARYWVQITGIKEPAGAESPLEYLVEFYRP
jgi:hypothetical protein